MIDDGGMSLFHDYLDKTWPMWKQHIGSVHYMEQRRAFLAGLDAVRPEARLRVNVCLPMSFQESLGPDERCTRFSGRLLDGDGRFISYVGTRMALDIVDLLNAASPMNCGRDS